MATQPSAEIDTFENPQSGKDYTIYIDAPEFTCLCPLTGQPDFARIEIEYVPDQLCIELKSLKNYLWTFRDRRAFHEAVSNEILGHLCAAIAPRHMRLTARFNRRGGIATSVCVEHRKKGWQG